MVYSQVHLFPDYFKYSSFAPPFGVIEGQNVFHSKIDSVFQSLKVKTWLCRPNIKKQEGQKDRKCHVSP